MQFSIVKYTYILCVRIYHASCKCKILYPLNNSPIPFSSPGSYYCLPSPWISLFQVPGINGMRQYCFFLWLAYFIQHNVLMFIDIVACIRISFLFKVEWFSILCIIIILFVFFYPSVDTWVASTFQLLWIMLLWTYVHSIFWDICVSLLGLP
jgi:hypothetical protein